MSRVKQIVRSISLGGGGTAVMDVDQYVSTYLEKGYSLLSTHVVDTIRNPDSTPAAIVVLYVLVLDVLVLDD